MKKQRVAIVTLGDSRKEFYKKREHIALAELEKVKAELDSKNDLLLRTAAEFDNYKKRTDRERAGIAPFS